MYTDANLLNLNPARYAEKPYDAAAKSPAHVVSPAEAQMLALTPEQVKVVYIGRSDGPMSWETGNWYVNQPNPAYPGAYVNPETVAQVLNACKTNAYYTNCIPAGDEQSSEGFTGSLEVYLDLGAVVWYLAA